MDHLLQVMVAKVLTQYFQQSHQLVVDLVLITQMDQEVQVVAVEEMVLMEQMVLEEAQVINHL